MTDHTEGRSRQSDEIARLIASAGPRRAPAPQIEQSVRAAVEQAWISSAGRRRGRRRALLWLASAASVTLMSAGLLWFALHRPLTSISADATLLATRGTVTVTAAHDKQLIVAGSRLPVGTTVDTARDGFVLMTVAAESMRLGPDSRLRIGRGGHVSLSRGRIYVETVDRRHFGPPLLVDTPFGRVSHLGTQFQVVVSGGAMAVSVRSGHVRVSESAGREQRLAAGQEVEVWNGGEVRHMKVLPYGAAWAWADSLLPDFPINGRPLSDFLAWYTHEMGLKLVLVGPKTAAAVRRTLLSGSIAGLTPGQALAAVMASTHFVYDQDVPGELRIRMRSRTVAHD